MRDGSEKAGSNGLSWRDVAFAALTAAAAASAAAAVALVVVPAASFVTRVVGALMYALM